MKGGGGIFFFGGGGGETIGRMLRVAQRQLRGGNVCDRSDTGRSWVGGENE